MKISIKGTAKLLNVNQGNISLKYDKDIKKWFKQFNQEDDEIIYMNYRTIVKQISKLIVAKVSDYYDYPYWDEHYTTCMDFYVEGVSDTKIRKALKGKVFTIKLEVDR